MRHLLHILIAQASAQVGGAPLPPTPPCGDLPGCGGSPANTLTETVLPEIARILLNSAAALSLLFVMIGGARYVLAFGRDAEQEKAKMHIFWALIGLIIALVSERIVVLVLSESWITDPADPMFSLIQNVIRIIMVLLNITFLLVIVLGGMRMVYAQGVEEEVKKGRHMVTYAVMGVVIINAAPLVVKALLHL